MAAPKQVVMFIVEGPTDENAFSEAMKGVFEDETVVFHVVHGDITTDPGVTPSNVISKVNAHIKEEMDRYGLKRGDICSIIHLIDTDGAFIPPECVIASENSRIEYTLKSIMTSKPEQTRQRNQRKYLAVKKLFATKSIAQTPYAIYYLSRNLEHVLFDKIEQLTDDQKMDLADQFAEHYSTDIEGFVVFMSDSCFAVDGSYSDTWNYIIDGTNSLNRKSNFHLAIKERIGNKKSESTH